MLGRHAPIPPIRGVYRDHPCRWCDIQIRSANHLMRRHRADGADQKNSGGVPALRPCAPERSLLLIGGVVIIH